MSNTEPLSVKPIAATSSLRTLAYEALKAAITTMDIYGRSEEIRLDERKLSQDLGVSRTPVREALTVLEQEGFVRSEARRGVFVVRKSKREIVEIIHAWTALESMAARLACLRADDEQLQALPDAFPEFFAGQPQEHIDEYSDANIRFHQTIITLGQCEAISELTGNLLVHVRAIRSAALRQGDRAERSVREHVAIIAALQARDAERAETLVRDHGLGLARHVDTYGDYLG